MAGADEILITNGDRLTWEIVRHDAYSVRLETDYAGTLDIKWSNIAEITLNEPSVVLLKDRTTFEVESFKQDQFADLDLRTLVGPGIGYRFFDSKPLNLNFELGPYYLKDDFIAQPDRKFWTGVRVPLIAGLFGSVEYEIDYDSEPAVEAETTDQTFKLKLGYKW